eukprot:3845210-Pleurochrysis_carterae.AAC.1
MGRLTRENAERGNSSKDAVSSATSDTIDSSVRNASPPSGVIDRPCSRESSRISGKNLFKGGKMLGT